MSDWAMLEAAKKVFEKHELTVIEHWHPTSKRGEYVWKNPLSGIYMAHIIFRPNTIIVYGDVQPHIIFRQDGIDLPWLRGSVHDPRYLFEKSQVHQDYDEERTREFALEMLQDWENERRDEDGELCEEDKVRSRYLHRGLESTDWSDQDSALDFLEELADDAVDCLLDSYEAAGVTYVLAALQTFIAALDKKVK